jgi:hypothetical protein
MRRYQRDPRPPAEATVLRRYRAWESRNLKFLRYDCFMPGHECYHCHQWVEENEAHDCWTTTEENLTAELSEDLMDAWERLRETATEFGPQRIYASHKSIMFSRKACYFFVRPKKKLLEVWFFLGRKLKAPLVRSTLQSSKLKVAHLVHIIHRDQVEAPLTDWLQEAYDLSDSLTAASRDGARQKKRSKPARKPAKKSSVRSR